MLCISNVMSIFAFRFDDDDEQLGHSPLDSNAHANHSSWSRLRVSLEYLFSGK